MKLYTVNSGYFKLDGGAMFGVVPKSIWQKINPPDERNLCSWAMRCMLIEVGDRLILVDNGIGNKQDEKFFSHYHLHGEDSISSSLKKLGFSENDITDVFLSHLHFDHCGGSVKKENGKLALSFPNANYWSNREQWDWAVNPNDREKASFLKENIIPIQESGRLKFIDVPNGARNGELGIFSPEISVLCVYGHTEAMMIPLVKYKGRTVAFMADLLPSHGHIPIPYVMAYDMFPLTTLQEKKSFLQTAVDNNYILFFEHDPEHECCELIRTEKGIRAGRFFSLSEI